MSTFTASLKEVLENIYGTTMDPDDYEVPRKTITYQGDSFGEMPYLPNNGSAIGLSQYPIFDEAYRELLNGKIIDEYYNREICTESIDDFKLILRRKMQQIMPYYNKLYESEALDYDALQTMDIHSVNQSTIDGTENVTANIESANNTTSGARVVTSDTPQTMLSPDGDYATGGTDSNSKSEVESNSNQTTTSNNDTTTNADNRVTGFQGVASELVARWRNAQINIDTMILNELQDCFFGLLNNGDSYTTNFGWI